MKIFIRSIAATLSFVLFITNSAGVYAAETTLWAERKKHIRTDSKSSNGSMQLASLQSSYAPVPSQLLNQIPSTLTTTLSTTISQHTQNQIPKRLQGKLLPLLSSIPTQFATVRRVQTSTGSTTAPTKTILYIQDVHMNKEAQSNIGRTVGALLDQNRIDMIALEGAFGKLNLKPFRSFPNKQANRIVADYLLNENKITGPVHAALTSSKNIPTVIGVDDQRLYDANIGAFTASISDNEKIKNELSQKQEHLDKSAPSILNPVLLTFYNGLKSYQEGKTPLTDHVLALATHLPHFSPNVDVFLEAAQMENNLNFKKIEGERQALLSHLLEKLSATETSTLLNTSVAYRLGNINHAAFYSMIKNLCETKKIPLKNYTAMNSYIQYALLSDGINSERLFGEINQMENQAALMLAKNESEAGLMKTAKQLYFESKLIDFSLTPEEWSEYTKHTEDKSALSNYENFYKQADARNIAMAENLLQAMQAQKASTAVLVTGGFHTPGIEHLLRNAGATVITIAPKITTADEKNGFAYLTTFAQEKTPLDQIFSGEKLFIGHDPFHVAPTVTAAGQMAAAIALGDDAGEAVENANSALGAEFFNPNDVRITGYGVRVRKLFFTFTNQVSDGITLISTAVLNFSLRFIFRRAALTAVFLMLGIHIFAQTPAIPIKPAPTPPPPHVIGKGPTVPGQEEQPILMKNGADFYKVLPPPVSKITFTGPYKPVVLKENSGARYLGITPAIKNNFGNIDSGYFRFDFSIKTSDLQDKVTEVIIFGNDAPQYHFMYVNGQWGVVKDPSDHNTYAPDTFLVFEDRINGKYTFYIRVPWRVIYKKDNLNTEVAFGIPSQTSPDFSVIASKTTDLPKKYVRQAGAPILQIPQKKAGSTAVPNPNSPNPMPKVGPPSGSKTETNPPQKTPENTSPDEPKPLNGSPFIGGSATKSILIPFLLASIAIGSAAMASTPQNAGTFVGHMSSNATFFDGLSISILVVALILAAITVARKILEIRKLAFAVGTGIQAQLLGNDASATLQKILPLGPIGIKNIHHGLKGLNRYEIIIFKIFLAGYFKRLKVHPEPSQMLSRTFDILNLISPVASKEMTGHPVIRSIPSFSVDNDGFTSQLEIISSLVNKASLNLKYRLQIDRADEKRIVVFFGERLTHVEFIFRDDVLTLAETNDVGALVQQILQSPDGRNILRSSIIALSDDSYGLQNIPTYIQREMQAVQLSQLIAGTVRPIGMELLLSIYQTGLKHA